MTRQELKRLIETYDELWLAMAELQDMIFEATKEMVDEDAHHTSLDAQQEVMRCKTPSSDTA